MIRSLLGVLFLLTAGPVIAQEPAYSDASTESCLQEAVGKAEQFACIGASARQCMSDDPSGSATPVVTYCLAREHDFWDRRLNVEYTAQMTSARADDPAYADALQALQRAWIVFRDARCNAVAVAWGPGTGRSPAFMECLMRSTAEQTLLLEGTLN